MRWNILLQGKNVELAYRVGQLFPWLSVFVSRLADDGSSADLRFLLSSTNVPCQHLDIDIPLTEPRGGKNGDR